MNDGPLLHPAEMDRREGVPPQPSSAPPKGWPTRSNTTPTDTCAWWAPRASEPRRRADCCARPFVDTAAVPNTQTIGHQIVVD
ncbi:hypothetical protein ACWDA9_30480, partial [Streptomyces sp. NPDC001193]